MDYSQDPVKRLLIVYAGLISTDLAISLINIPDGPFTSHEHVYQQGLCEKFEDGYMADIIDDYGDLLFFRSEKFPQEYRGRTVWFFDRIRFMEKILETKENNPVFSRIIGPYLKKTIREIRRNPSCLY